MKKNESESIRLGGVLISGQIVRTLIDELRSGCYAASERLPSEVELAQQFNVSRTVIRDALSELEREGYIERVRGLGTVINRDVVSLHSRIDQKLEYYPLIRSLGAVPHADSFEKMLVAADANLAASLRVEPGSMLVRISKRILADSKPVIYSIDYFPAGFLDGKDIRQLDLNGSVFDILEKVCGMQAASNLAHIKACTGHEPDLARMGADEQEAFLLLDEVCYNRICQPIMRSFSYYTDYFDFSILRKLM